MRTRIMGSLCVVTLTIVLAQSGYAQQRPVPKLNELVKAAQVEGELNIVAGSGTWGESEGVKIIQDALNKKYGLNTRIRFAAGASMPVLGSRIVEQYKAGVKSDTDIFVVNAVSLKTILQERAVRPFPWREAFPYIPADTVELENQVIRHVDVFVGVSYNTREIPAKEVPQYLEDVLAPKWKGKIASTPYAAGLDYLPSPRVWGYEKATAFVRALSKQIGGLIRCGEEPRIASGEFLMLVMNCGNYSTDVYAQRTGAPLGTVILKDAALVNTFYYVVPKNSEHPNLATLIVAFLMSKEGQDILYRVVGWTSASVEGTDANKKFKELKAKGVKFNIFTATTYMGEEAEHLRKATTEYQKILAGR